MKTDVHPMQGQISLPDFRAQFVEPAKAHAHTGYAVPIHAHNWLRYPAGGPGWRICKWCALVRNPDESQAE